jgi:hypothetical protein
MIPPSRRPFTQVLWTALLIAFLVGWFAYNFNHGERIQHNGGLGWDGAAYADWAQRSSVEVLSSRKVSQYYIGRILPSLVIHQVSKFVGYDIQSTARVIHAFYIYNFFLLMLAASLLVLIGRHYRWTWQVHLLGFAALFLNYPVLKNYPYNPTLVDISGLVIGLALLYFYLKDWFAALCAVSFVGAFVWPTMLYGALPLLMFGRITVQERGPQRHGHALAALAGLGLLTLAAYLYFVQGLRQTPGTTTFKTAMLPLSVALFLAYLYAALHRLIDVPAALQAARGIRWFRVAAGIALFVGTKAITFHFSDRSAGPLTITSYLGLFTQASLSNPLVNLVAHAMHYGPVYLLAFFVWPKVVEITKEEGLGLTAFVALFAFLSIGPESRQFINAWPVFAVLICEAVHRSHGQKVDWYFTASMVVMSLVLSRFWLPINVGPWTGNFQAFPDQMLYMYSGPWMSHQMYAVFLAVTILSTLAVAALLRPLKQTLPSNDAAAA